ncbi:hypothetical protein GCM10027168_11410 [Streptomyces capparidis]
MPFNHQFDTFNTEHAIDIPLPLSAAVRTPIASPDGKYIYAHSRAAGKGYIFTLNTATGKFEKPIIVETDVDTRYGAMCLGGPGTLYATWDGNRIFEVDLTTGKSIPHTKENTANVSWDLETTPDRKRIYIAGKFDENYHAEVATYLLDGQGKGTYVVQDTKLADRRMRLSSTKTSAGVQIFAFMATEPGGIAPGNDEIIVVDNSLLKIHKRVGMQPPKQIGDPTTYDTFGIAASPEGDAVYVSGIRKKNVSPWWDVYFWVYDTQTEKLSATYSPDVVGDHLTFAPPGANKLYLASTDTTKFVAFDTAKNKLGATTDAPHKTPMIVAYKQSD